MTTVETPATPTDAGAPDATSVPDAGPSPADLQAALAEAQARADAFREDSLRARAELDNLHKRTARDVENAHRYGAEKLVQELLPVKDSLELGLAAAAAPGTAQIREGLELTLRMLATALERVGVAEVDPAGQRFNPEQHQAIGTDTTAPVEPGTVVTVVQKGYLLRDRLLRPALVRVAAAPAA